MDTFNMQTKTILKTNRIYPYSVCRLVEGKKDLIVIAQSDGLHIFNLHEN